jgi:carboxypeptidase Q
MVFRRSQPVALSLLFLSLLSSPLRAQQTAPADAIARIKDEGLNRSQVMQTLSYLTDVIGPRLTGSPNMKRANEWTRDKLTAWGLQNAHLEAWGPFGRGWSLERFSAQIVSPQDIPLIAYPAAWSPGLPGTYVGDVVYIDAKDEAGLEKYKGHLKGMIALTSPEREVKAHFEPLGTRWTDEQLQKMQDAKPAERGARRQGSRFQLTPEQRAQRQFRGRLAQFLQEEGVAVLVSSSANGDGGTIFVQSATVPGGANAAGGRPAGPWDKDAPPIVPQITLAKEHYNRLLRMLAQGEKLKMAVELEVKFYDQDLMSYNTIAEIPGSDLKDQVVMLGAHMDSWHSGTGATDNGAGCAVCMEAVRILKTLNLQPRRTIRIGLWSGEEEGLYGSRAYVAEHFGSRPRTAPGEAPGELTRKPDYDRLSGYFNLDNGTGKVRGIYLQGNEAVRPLFQAWLAPFKEMGASTVTINNTGGTDHQSFDAIGLPGFQFIQDEIEYDSRTHHSNQDVFDRAQADDLKQAAVIMAAFVYNTAMQDQPLPHKPQPAPQRPAP